jgi:hypothetical protein
MKKTAFLMSSILIAGFASLMLAGEPPPTNQGASHIGTWRLVSAKYADAKEFSEPAKDEKHIKMITATHFTWATYDEKKRLILSSMGGSYTLQNGDYTETVEFFFPEDMKAYLDKKQTFKLKIDGDKWTQSGTLSDGMKIEEIWQRVK